MKESTEQRPVLPPISDVAAERSNDPDGFIWQRLDQELERLLDLDDPRSRSEHLELLRIRDAELAAQLESMLVSADDDFLERPCELCVPALSALEDPAEGFEPQQWLGRTVGNWKLEDLLGAGGMGAVFRARRADGQFVQVAALKMLALEHEGFGGRFLAERQILARLEHPNIARLIDGGVSPEGRPFLVTELVEGEPIDRWAQAGEIDLEARLKAFQQVCDAVEAAHRSLIVHRDIKPANVMVSPIAPVSGGRQVSAKVHVKLLDFGVARLLSAEDPRGFDDRAPLTPGFAAPEQLAGDPVSTATDVWALGCLLSCLLTGRSPWRPLPGESTEALRRRIRTAAGPPPEWNLGRTPSPGLRLSTGQARDLEAIVRRCLQLQPQARYGSAREVAEDVRRHLEGRPVAARGDSKLYRWGRAIRRNRVALVAAVLLVLLVGVAMRLLVQQAREAERQLLQAERVMSFVQEVLRPEVITAPGVTAASVIEAGVDTARRRFASDPEIEAAVLTALGSQLSALEAYPSARSALSRALELRRNLGDLEGQVEATTALAWVEVEDEQLERGLEEMEQLVRELRRRPARDRLVLADALYEQGFLVLRRVPEDDPRKADAWAHLLEALQILEAVLPEGHPLRARAEFAVGLATVPQEDGVERLERAVAHMRRQGEGSEEALAHAVGDLALVYENVGRQEDAVRTAQEAIELIERIRSPGNADRLIMLNNLAGILRDAGRYAAAEPLYEEVLEGRLRMFSDDASVLAFPLYGLGRVRMGLGRYDEAVEDLRQARDLVEAQGWFQEGVAVRLALGESLLEAGDLDEAATLLDQLTEDLQQRAPGGSELEQVEQLQEQLAQRQGEASS